MTGRLAVLVGVLWLIGCGGDSTGPGTVDITGTWLVTATLNNSSLGITCNEQGTATVTQSGTNVSGQFTNSLATCSTPSGTASESLDGPLTGGQVLGTTATFVNSECTYTGTISGSPPNRIQGAATCQVSVQGQVIPLTGTWLATR